MGQIPINSLVAATLLSSLAFAALHGAWLATTPAGIGFALARYHRGKLCSLKFCVSVQDVN